MARPRVSSVIGRQPHPLALAITVTATASGTATPTNDVHLTDSGHLPAADQSESQVASDSVLQSDQRIAIVQNIPAVRAARRSVGPQSSTRGAMARDRPRRHSRSEFTTTSAPSSVQKIVSFHANWKAPRSQNHWYAWRNQVTAKTRHVDATSAATGALFRSAKYAG